MNSGEKYGKLTFLGTTKTANRKSYGDFLCDCGRKKSIRVDAVKSGRSRSCGCARKNNLGMDSETYEKLYNVWANMIKRCHNLHDDRFYTYGARGISVCHEWRNSFKDFAKWAHRNGWNPNLSLERKDVEGMYCPENCTFITMAAQMRNKTNNIRIIIDGDERCLTEWCEILDVPFKTAWMRGKRYGYGDLGLIFYKGDVRELRNA